MKPETKSILEKARRTLAAARRDLASDDADNAISRAYYATFHAATAALHEKGLAAKSHTGTHHLFHQEYGLTGRIDQQTSKTLSRLFQDRMNAEYTFGTTFGPKAATDAIEQAEAFVEAVAALLST